jgi:hypothetical protein
VNRGLLYLHGFGMGLESVANSFEIGLESAWERFGVSLGFDDNDDNHWRGVERIGAVWNGSDFEEWVEALWNGSGTQLNKLWSWGFVE